jgi:L-ascorbate metabolism protein UlaG (beta-lactamase superfamily)
MELTHFGHSCLLARFAADGAAGGQTATVLFDPGTHQHPDHSDPVRLPALVEANPQAKLYADPMTAAQLGGSWQAVHVGDTLSIGHLTVRGAGGKHAVIHPDIPIIDNISYLVGDAGHAARLMHPGDALFVPDEPVEVLAAPAAAPWMKIAEAVDFLRAVAPQHAVPIHQGVVAEQAKGIYYGRLDEMTSTDFRVLTPEQETRF